jgi:hypothetical protein
VWRIIVSQRFGSVSKASDILHGWSWDELQSAHDALDFAIELDAPSGDTLTA